MTAANMAPAAKNRAIPPFLLILISAPPARPLRVPLGENQFHSLRNRPFHTDGRVCTVILLSCLIFAKWYDKFTTLPVELFQNRHLIWKLAKNDFKKRYAGSYMGAVWALAQPVVTVAMYYIVFDKLMGNQVSRGSGDIPYVLFLTAGLVPWFYFNEALNGGTNAMLEYNYLVKKVVYPAAAYIAEIPENRRSPHADLQGYVNNLCQIPEKDYHRTGRVAQRQYKNKIRKTMVLSGLLLHDVLLDCDGSSVWNRCGIVQAPEGSFCRRTVTGRFV